MLKISPANDRVSLSTVGAEPRGQQLAETRTGGKALRARNLCVGCFHEQMEVVAHHAVRMQHEMKAGDDTLQHA